MVETSRETLLRQGFVVVPKVVPELFLQAVVDDVERHCGISVDDPDSWYTAPEITPLGMVTDDGRRSPHMFHYPSMWAIREHPDVYAVFAELLGVDRLWVSIDNVCVKPPVHPEHPSFGHTGFIHWDRFRWSMADPATAIDQSKNPDTDLYLAGIVALTDTPAGVGGFQCVPEIYADLDQWLTRQPDDWNPRDPDLTSNNVTRVEMNAGDMCVWTTRLPHGNGDNTSTRLRLAQYITMYPVPYGHSDFHQRREQRIESWRTRTLPGSPTTWSSKESGQPPPTLSVLGERLLGRTGW